MMKKATVITISVMLFVCLLSMTVIAAPYVAYWNFDNDATELINGYTPSNPGAFTTVDGENGKAYGGSLGDNSGVVKYDVNIPLASSFTCTVWVKGDYNVEAGGYFVMMAKNPKATDGHFEFYWNPGGQFSVYATNTDMVSILESVDPMDDGQWHHYVIRVVDNEWELYIDGVLNNTYSAPEPLTIAAGPMYFGSLVDDTLQSQTPFDDLLFLDYAIDVADIPAIMNDTQSYAEAVAGIINAGASNDIVAAETKTVAETTSTPITTTIAPQTSDTTMVIMVLLMISAALAIVSVKKRTANK